MARRNLLTNEERRRLFEPRVDELPLIRNYTLSIDDLDIIGNRRGNANRLGIAAQLSLLRFPGFGLRTNEDLPLALHIGTQFNSSAQQITCVIPVRRSTKHCCPMYLPWVGHTLD